MVYEIQTGGRREGRILPNRRAIVLHQGGQYRWVRGMKRWLIRAQKPRSERISWKGQAAGRRLRWPLGLRRRLLPQAFRSIPRSSPSAPKATLGSIPCARVRMSPLYYKEVFERSRSKISPLEQTRLKLANPVELQG